MTTLDTDAPRRRHYGRFYGLDPLPPEGEPVLVVHGNCQAEAIRVVIAASTDQLHAVRLPPVHELTADDLPHLHRLLARTAVIASQPVGDDYRDLPIGTAQLAAAAPQAKVVRWPVVRYTGLHPYGALIRTPWRGDPPVVPYHDLRTIAGVARRWPAGQRPAGDTRPEAFRTVAAQSIEELDRREREGDLVVASDLIGAAGSAAMLTINHPGNAVLVPLAGRILEAAGITGPVRDPGRTLLPSIHAPIRADVVDALGLDPSVVREDWAVGEARISDDEVAAGQREWYATRPEIIAAALDRYAPATAALGL